MRTYNSFSILVCYKNLLSMYIYTREITGCLPLLNIRGGLLRLCGYGLHFLYVLHSTNSYIHKYILTNTKCIYENNPAFDHTLHESSNAFPMQRSYSDQFRICNIILLSKVYKNTYTTYTKLQESSLNVGNSKILYT